MRTMGLRCETQLCDSDVACELGNDTGVAPAFQLLLPQTPIVKVKNTFIQDDEDDEDDGEMPPMIATKSCPAAPLRLDAPWKCSAGTIQEVGIGCSDSEDEEEHDAMLPMRVTRTCSDFSTASRVARQEYFHEAVAMDYGFEYTPPACLGGSPVHDPSFLDFGVEPTMQERVSSRGSFGAGASTTSRRTLPPVTVKNTFIHAFLEKDEEEEDSIPMIATRSCPAPSMPTLSSVPDVPPGLGYEARFLDLVTQQLQMQAARRGPPGSWHFPQPQTLSSPVREESPATRQTSSESEETASSDASTRMPTTVVKPVEHRVPEWSEGARLHATGECRPCAWFWRDQGCLNGEECKHCHLCHRDAVKERRKARKGRKQQEQQ